MSDFKTIKSGKTWVVEIDGENWILTGDPSLYENSDDKELLFCN